ncbi:MAG: hypothetical protein QOK49_1773 [Baekduia sp.]|jgi:hypothetical protein|nr:hypothetical protein [Baekduia sp.]
MPRADANPGRRQGPQSRQTESAPIHARRHAARNETPLSDLPQSESACGAPAQCRCSSDAGARSGVVLAADPGEYRTGMRDDRAVGELEGRQSGVAGLLAQPVP